MMLCTIPSGQIIATSHDLTPNGGLVREIPLFQGNLGWWNIIIWPDSIEFQSYSNVLMPSRVWKKCLHRHHKDCNCLSGAREGKLKRRPLVVGNAVDNKIICWAPRSNKNSAKSHSDPKKTGFFCSDDSDALVSSVLVVSDFFIRCLFQSQVEKGAYTALVSQLGSDGEARVLVESKVQGPRQIFSGSLPQSSWNMLSTQRQQQQLPELPLPWTGACRSHRRWSGCLYIYPDQLPRSPGAWRRVDRREKNKAAAALPVGKMTTREIAGMRTQRLGV